MLEGERQRRATCPMMKDQNPPANVVSASRGLHAEDSSAQKREEARIGLSGEPGADELATVLAMRHATLESTTDAILVTDETNYVSQFNEKHVRFWGIPSQSQIAFDL